MVVILNEIDNLACLLDDGSMDEQEVATSNTKSAQTIESSGTSVSEPASIGYPLQVSTGALLGPIYYAGMRMWRTVLWQILLLTAIEALIWFLGWWLTPYFIYSDQLGWMWTFGLFLIQIFGLSLFGWYNLFRGRYRAWHAQPGQDPAVFQRQQQHWDTIGLAVFSVVLVGTIAIAGTLINHALNGGSNPVLELFARGYATQSNSSTTQATVPSLLDNAKLSNSMLLVEAAIESCYQTGKNSYLDCSTMTQLVQGGYLSATQPGIIMRVNNNGSNIVAYGVFASNNCDSGAEYITYYSYQSNSSDSPIQAECISDVSTLTPPDYSPTTVDGPSPTPTPTPTESVADQKAQDLEYSIYDVSSGLETCFVEQKRTYAPCVMSFLLSEKYIRTAPDASLVLTIQADGKDALLYVPLPLGASDKCQVGTGAQKYFVYRTTIAQSQVECLSQAPTL